MSLLWNFGYSNSLCNLISFNEYLFILKIRSKKIKMIKDWNITNLKKLCSLAKRIYWLGTPVDTHHSISKRNMSLSCLSIMILLCRHMEQVGRKIKYYIFEKRSAQTNRFRKSNQHKTIKKIIINLFLLTSIFQRYYVFVLRENE